MQDPQDELKFWYAVFGVAVVLTIYFTLLIWSIAR